MKYMTAKLMESDWVVISQALGEIPAKHVIGTISRLGAQLEPQGFGQQPEATDKDKKPQTQNRAQRRGAKAKARRATKRAKKGKARPPKAGKGNSVGSEARH